MFVLGHSGIGSALARPLVGVGAWAEPRARTFWLIVAGTLLPDLVDKPLYYGLVAATGRRAAELGLVSGTRTFGHTLLAVAAVVTIGLIARRRAAGAAVALGMLTHLVLDEIGDLLGGLPTLGTTAAPSTLHAILFPLLGAQFPVMPFRDAAAHAGSLRSPYVVVGELVGALIWLRAWLLWRRARREGAGTPSVSPQVR